MKKIGVLILSIVIVSSLLVGCGGKKEVSKTTDSKKVTQTQNQTTDNKNSSTTSTSNNGTSNSASNSNSNSTAGTNSTSNSSTAAGQATISQLQKEEKQILDNHKSITEADEKKYPMLAVQKYLLEKYNGQADFGKKDVRVISDNEIVYFCAVALSGDDFAFRKVTMKYAGSQWTEVNDESFDPKNY